MLTFQQYALNRWAEETGLKAEEADPSLLHVKRWVTTSKKPKPEDFYQKHLADLKLTKQPGIRATR